MWTMAARGRRYTALGEEPHTYDVEDLTDVSQTAKGVTLNGMVQGADATERVGNKILMRRLDWIFSMNNELNLVQLRQQVRLLFVYDLQTNGALPAMTAVLTSDSRLGFPVVANQDRFLILKDQLIEFNAFGNGAAAGATFVTRTGSIDLDGLQTTYNAAAAGVGSIATGGLYAYFVGCTAAGTEDINGSLETRLTFDT